MQESVILERVETDDEIGDKRPSFVEMPGKAFERLVVLVEHMDLHAVEDDVAVGDGSRNPFREQVTCAREPCCLRDELGLARPRADEQDQAASVGDLLDNTRGAAQMGGRLLEGDDVDALADAVDVAAVGWVPERGVVAHVRLGRHEELERDVFGARGVEEEVARPVPLVDV